jgi:uncharacterized membrane protein
MMTIHQADQMIRLLRSIRNWLILITILLYGVALL